MAKQPKYAATPALAKTYSNIPKWQLWDALYLFCAADNDANTIAAIKRAVYPVDSETQTTRTAERAGT